MGTPVDELMVATTLFPSAWADVRFLSSGACSSCRLHCCFDDPASLSVPSSNPLAVCAWGTRPFFGVCTAARSWPDPAAL